MHRRIVALFYGLLLALAAGRWPQAAVAAESAGAPYHGNVELAENHFGKLSGHVYDADGAPVADVSVLVIEISRGTVTGQDGSYSLLRIPAGTYRVSFTRSGYAPEIRRAVVSAQTPALDVALRETVIELSGIQVTASANPTTALTSPQPVAILDESELRTRREASLGETIQDMPGVRSWNTGSGIGKPVIRGLGSDRVLVALDGQRIETQQWGDEHSPNIGAGDIDHIEVIRGPASVLYGSDALGGVVNIIARPLPSAIGRDPFLQGRAASAYGSNNGSIDGGFTLEGARKGLGFRSAWHGRHNGDMHTPGGALFNTGYESGNTLGALGYKGGWGSVEGQFTHRTEEIEIHEDPSEDPEASPFQKIQEDFARLSSSLPVGARSRLELTFNFERNRRREFEQAGSNEVALGLLSKTISGLAHFHHPPAGPFEGLAGFTAIRSTFDKFGQETLIPNSAAVSYGLFLFEQADKDPWSFSFGARYDHRNLKVESDAELEVKAQTRRWNAFSGNAGLLYRISDPLALVLNVGRGFRAPSSFDLFSNGVHEGTVAFERGNPELVSENSLNTDLALRVQTTRVRVEISAFVNRIGDYIYSRPSGSFDPESGFEFYDVVQGDASLAGFEISAAVQPDRHFHLSAGVGWVRGENTSTGNALPWIPPLRLTGALRYESDPLGSLKQPYLELGLESDSRQTRIDPAETAVAGYALGRLGAGCKLSGGPREMSLDLTVRNLFDKKYSNFLSRYKAYALDQGRAAVLRVGMKF